jgi:hypothetical protein
LKKVNRQTWLSVVSAILTLALWEAAVDLRWVKSPFLVAPSKIVIATVNLVVGGELLEDISVTLARIITLYPDTQFGRYRYFPPIRTGSAGKGLDTVTVFVYLSKAEIVYTPA